MHGLSIFWAKSIFHRVLLFTVLYGILQQLTYFLNCAFRLRADNGPLLVVFESPLSSSTRQLNNNNKNVKVRLPLIKLLDPRVQAKRQRSWFNNVAFCSRNESHAYISSGYLRHVSGKEILRKVQFIIKSFVTSVKHREHWIISFCDALWHAWNCDVE